MGLDNPLKIGLIIIVLLLVFGAKRLPEIGKAVGQSLREFKGAAKGVTDDVRTGLDDEEPAAEPDSKAKKKAATTKAATTKRPTKGSAE